MNVLENVFETNHYATSTMREHRHGSPFVTIVLEGGYVEVRDTTPEICGAGSVVIHPSGEEHADRFSADTRCLNIEFEENDESLFAWGQVPLDTERLRKGVAAVRRAHDEHTHQLRAAISEMRCALRDRSRVNTETPPWLGPVLHDFEWDSVEPLRKAAQLAGVHETHFSGAFRRHLHVTANEYRARARMRTASKLLLSSTDSLSRIALRSGFSDQSHLTRAFTKRLGLSPAAYRRIFAR